MQIQAANQHPLSGFDQHRFESPLEDVSAASMSSGPPNAVGDIEPLDRRAEISLRSAHQQMIMVAHQNITVDFDKISLPHLRQQLQKVPAISLIQKNDLPVIAAIGDMIPAILEIDSQRSSHARQITPHSGKASRPKVICQDVTPMTQRTR